MSIEASLSMADLPLPKPISKFWQKKDEQNFSKIPLSSKLSNFSFARSGVSAPQLFSFGTMICCVTNLQYENDTLLSVEC